MSHSLLQRIANGDSGAADECIAEYGGLVWNLAQRLSRTPAEAAEATQEIFLDLWQGAGQFAASRDNDRTFITVIARRRLISRLTTIAPHFFEQGSWMSPFDRNDVATAFAESRSDFRRVLELAWLEGLSEAEICVRTGLPPGTVKSFLRRGLSRVRGLKSARPVYREAISPGVVEALPLPALVT